MLAEHSVVPRVRRIATLTALFNPHSAFSGLEPPASSKSIRPSEREICDVSGTQGCKGPLISLLDRVSCGIEASSPSVPTPQVPAFRSPLSSVCSRLEPLGHQEGPTALQETGLQYFKRALSGDSEPVLVCTQTQIPGCHQRFWTSPSAPELSAVMAQLGYAPLQSLSSRNFPGRSPQLVTGVQHPCLSCHVPGSFEGIRVSSSSFSKSDPSFAKARGPYPPFPTASKILGALLECPLSRHFQKQKGITPVITPHPQRVPITPFTFRLQSTAVQPPESNPSPPTPSPSSSPPPSPFTHWPNGGGQVHREATVDSTAVVEAGAMVEAGAVVGPGAVIGSGSVVGPKVHVGSRTELHFNVSLENCKIGEACILHNGVSIGAEGFGFYIDAQGNMVKKPQLLGVIIGDGVEIGANSCVDRGSWRDTSIGDHTKIDNLVQIGHNVVIGRCCIICGQTGLGGSSTLGDYVVLAGQVGVADHVSIASKVRVAAKSGITANITKPGDYAGYPTVPASEWRRQAVIIRKLGRGSSRDEPVPDEPA